MKTSMDTFPASSSGPRWRYQQRDSILATYTVVSPNMEQAAKAIARGQSVGHPTVYTSYENEEFLRKYQAKYRVRGHNTIQVSYPKLQVSRQGVNYLLSVLIGGQCDIDSIKECRLVRLELGCIERYFPKPAFGISKIREFLGVHNRPLVGGIVKPKIGLTPEQVADVCKQMADGGIDFIKEDEILADQTYCRFEERVGKVAKALESYKLIYAPCITDDGSKVWKKARQAYELGATAVHLNIWCGLGTYLDVRKHVKIPIFFQKSGDKTWTTGPYSISYSVICKLVNLIGCDFAHVGMYGGYLSEPVGVLNDRIQALGSTVPSFSCGMNPQLATEIKGIFGNNLMVTAGGYLCGHPGGVTQAVKELREAVA